MKIAIGSDHQGYKLKEKIIKYLNKRGHKVTDFGSPDKKSTDFPIYAFKVAKEVSADKFDFGIVICGTGIGMSIAANKVKGIRCALVKSIRDARIARKHNNANMLAISGKTNDFVAKDMIDQFLKTNFSKVDRYQKRNDLITAYEESNKNEH